jgi:hypothetical protein
MRESLIRILIKRKTKVETLSIDRAHCGGYLFYFILFYFSRPPTLRVPNFLGGIDSTTGDDIAPHDTSKDIDQNGFDLGVGVQDLKPLLDLLFRCSTTGIQKFGRGSSHELNDIHSRHGQTRSIDHTTNVSIQTNVIQIVLLGGFDFLWIFFLRVVISLIKDGGLSVVFGVGIKL